MPLPDPDTKWPPPAHAQIHNEIATWAAWWTGDREQLAAVYGGAGNLPTHFFGGMPHRGGVAGALSRFFWGEPVRVEQRSSKLHVPAAADIASTSAAMLFAEPPRITVEDSKAQDRLDELFDERTWAELVEAAELAAGLGGVFLRVGWDDVVADRPLLSVIGPDLAVPTFRWGRLDEVTFTWTLERSRDGTVTRHLEHHSPGVVEHGLYLGNDRDLGRLVPLTEHPDTTALAESVDDTSSVETELRGLDVVYVPNAPARRWRTHRIGANLGQPDICGVEPLLDALDEGFTAWMRDVRLGKARAVVPQNFLDTAGPGRGASFDLDRELFVGVNALAGTGEMPIHVVQPAIRHVEHAATTTALLERIVTGAGYSAQTFGLTGEVAMTATESYARERKTHQTRGVKIRYWSPALADLAEILLTLDAGVFGSGVTPVRPSVEFGPPARDGVETLARTAQLLRGAEAASTETLVRLVHPDMDDDPVQAEVDAIVAERMTGPVHLDDDARLAELPE